AHHSRVAPRPLYAGPANVAVAGVGAWIAIDVPRLDVLAALADCGGADGMHLGGGQKSRDKRRAAIAPLHLQLRGENKTVLILESRQPLRRGVDHPFFDNRIGEAAAHRSFTLPSVPFVETAAPVIEGPERDECLGWVLREKPLHGNQGEKSLPPACTNARSR